MATNPPFFCYHGEINLNLRYHSLFYYIYFFHIKKAKKSFVIIGKINKSFLRSIHTQTKQKRQFYFYYFFVYVYVCVFKTKSALYFFKILHQKIFLFCFSGLCRISFFFFFESYSCILQLKILF